MEGGGGLILGAISENIGELHIIALHCRLLTELIALQWMPDIGSKDGRKRYDTTTDTEYSS